MAVRYRDLVKPWAADPRGLSTRPLLPTTKEWFRMSESERLEARDQLLAELAAGVDAPIEQDAELLALASAPAAPAPTDIPTWAARIAADWAKADKPIE